MKNLAVLISSLVFVTTQTGNAAGLPVGTVAPGFEAKNQKGETRKLSDFKGKWVLLYFYPKDDTPGCTKQACELRDKYDAFKKAGITIFGVSKQGLKSHEGFSEKYKVPFDLLVDEDGKIGASYEIETYPLVGIYRRQSVLIDQAGRVSHFFDSVDPATHHQMVLDAVVPPKAVEPAKAAKAK